ncbi:MAG TPA: hypothetical protein VNZ01_15545 [Solirubrobacteraceae bacterium]|nr:hypothetical protein [Solirubrobacteraceae bacterium]
MLRRIQDRALLDGPFPQGGLVRGVSDISVVLSEDFRIRRLAMRRVRETGSTVVRIPVDWRHTVISEPEPGFRASDPAAVAYRFAHLDASVRSAVAAGLSPLLVVVHAPAFAEAAGRWPYAYPGSWAPSPLALGEFAIALSSRYDGSFPDPLNPGQRLPRVRLFQAWNEPNLARFLEPQWVAEGRHWRPFSPLAYREMLNAFYAGVKSVRRSDVVLAAGIAPNGEPAGVGRMTPVQFLSQLFCLTPNGRHGNSQCADPPHLDVLTFHPLSFADPDLPAPSSLDVAMSDLAKVTRLLKRAEKLRTVLPAGPKPLWVTELNWESAPESSEGVPPALQPRWISRAMHRLWIAGVSLVHWEFLVDPYPALRAQTPTGGTIEYERPAGLYSPGPGGDFQQARAKPFLAGFTFPFDPLRTDSRHVRVWALLMRSGQSVSLQRLRRGDRWRNLARLRADRNGVINVLVPLRGPARLRLTDGQMTSATASIWSRRAF